MATKQNILDKVSAAVAVIEADGASAEEVLMALNFIDALNELYKQLRTRVNNAAVGWIHRNGDITCGDIRWYVGTTRDYRCRDVKGAMEALLNATGGDLDAAAACLSSDAWKPGATRTTVGDQKFDELFETRIKLEPATGKPKRELKKVNTKFQPKES